MPDNNLQINITAAVEVAALRQLETSLQRQVVEARALQKPVQDLENQLAGVQQRLGGFSFFDKAKSELTEFASKIPGVGALVNSLNGSFLSVAGGVAVLKEGAQAVHAAVAAFEQAEQRLVGLRAALALTGQANTANEQSVMALVKAQKEFAIAGSESQPVIETLLKLGRVRVEQLGQEFESVKGLAALTGGDLTTAATLWSKALEGNTTMLQRWMPELKTATSQEEKLAMARERLTEAAKAFDAQAETDLGAHKKLNNALGDLMSRLGGMINTVVPFGDGVRTAAKFTQDLANVLPSVTSNVAPVNSALAESQQVTKELAATFETLGLKAKGALSGAGADGLEGELDGVAKKADDVNAKLEETLRIQNEFREADTAVKIANLRLEETTALGKETTPEGRRIVEAQFAEKRRQIEDAAKLAKLTDEKSALQAPLANAQIALTPLLNERVKLGSAQTAAHAELEQYQGKMTSEGFAQGDPALIAQYEEVRRQRDEGRASIDDMGPLESSSPSNTLIRQQQPAREAAERAQRAEYERAIDRAARQKALQDAADAADKNFERNTKSANGELTKLTKTISEFDSKLKLLDAKIAAVNATSTADQASGQEKIKEAQQAASDKATKAAADAAKKALEDQIKAQSAILENPASTGGARQQARAEKLRLELAKLKLGGDEPGAADKLIAETAKQDSEEKLRQYEEQLREQRTAAHASKNPLAINEANAKEEELRRFKVGLGPAPAALAPPGSPAPTGPAPLPNIKDLQSDAAQAIAHHDTARAALDQQLIQLIRQLMNTLDTKSAQSQALENQIRNLSGRVEAQRP